jgi:hypothetical protein
MSITTYGELKTAVANWLERDDLTPRVPEFIALAENRIAKTARLREMETNTTTAMVVGQKPYALPSNYIQFIRVTLATSPIVRLEYRSPVHYWSVYGNLANGTPSVFTIEGENLLLGGPPDSTDNIDFQYYAKPTAFSADADTNTVLTTATGLYLYGALLESAPFLGNDPRVLVWTQMYEDILDKAHDADRKDRFSGDAQVTKWTAQNDPRAA